MQGKRADQRDLSATDTPRSRMRRTWLVGFVDFAQPSMGNAASLADGTGEAQDAMGSTPIVGWKIRPIPETVDVVGWQSRA